MSRYSARVSKERRFLVLCGGILIAAVVGMWVFLSAITLSEPDCRVGDPCTGVAASPDTATIVAPLRSSPRQSQ